ncbi:hypothetical protein EVAR_84156_1 [Eumeta japonica]|uniref:Retrovirus-related Pol polyprotein from type-1 retrotransposable element R1 n=1 Tax=Eumeta variegata TaxID=151549 RepID=A0A4C2ABZ7_EUMVA|nr:hypothetical protein EVAR_84156_1 [Eumeta japonica]
MKPATYAGATAAPGLGSVPLVQCSRCLGFGHGKQYCKDESDNELRRYPGCRVVQKTAPWRGPVKAAIMVLNSDVDVEEDQNLNGENVAAAVIKAGNCRIGVVSVYFEGDMPIGPYLDRVRYVCSKLGTDKIILGAMSTRGVYGGAANAMMRGVDLCDFLDSKDCISYTRAIRPCLRAEEWQVVRDVTSSDHNAVTFAVRVEGRSGPRPLSGTRVYNTAKARWSEFRTAMDVALNERTLTTEMVKSVGSCDPLDEVVETYTECIRQACDAAIPRKSSNTRGLKPPWWSPELEGLKRDARKKKRRIRNAAPAGGSTWSGSMCRLGRFTKGQWLRRRRRAGNGFALHRMERACGTASTGSGRVSDPPGGNLFPDDRVDTDDPYHTEVRRRTDGVVNHPKLRGSAQGGPTFTGAEVCSLCWAKQWKGCWSGASSGTNAETSGDAVWLHAAARDGGCPL